MKNLIEPKTLALLGQKPTSYEAIAEFLALETTDLTATQLCRLIDVSPQYYFNWKSRAAKASATSQVMDSQDIGVEVAGGKKKKYSAEDKFSLIKQYSHLEGPKKAEFLRKFGLYQSDLERWEAQVKEVALEALSKRKVRRDKKTAEQIELEEVKKELKGQEKTIAKLAALVVIQKKVSEILSSTEQD